MGLLLDFDSRDAADHAACILAIRKARTDLAAFIQLTYPSYQMGWVHRLLCQKLDHFVEEVVARRSPRLLILMPPRHGKSEIATKRLPAYFLGRHPEMSIISASYSASLATRFGRAVQQIMMDDVYSLIFPDVLLPGTTRAQMRGYGRDCVYTRTADLFETCGYGGSYRCTGVGGGVTGMGADIFLIDDPIKDRAEADSFTIRENVWDWFTSTAYTRLAPGGGIIVVMTPWHMNDLSGRLLEEAENGGDKYEVLRFPAIAEHDEEFRKEGDPLHAQRYSIEALHRIQRVVGERDWSALYQCRPVPQGGSMIKESWLTYYTTPPTEFDKMVMSWDMTFKDNDHSDYVVGQVWGRKGVDYYLLDQVRGRWSFTETLRILIALCNKWPKVVRKLIEDKANGTAVIDVVRKHIQGVIAVNPKDSKESRLNAVSTLFESHNVHLPHVSIAPWIRDYASEMLQFPAGAHDDQIDATTQALSDLQSAGRIAPENILALRR